MTAAKIAKFIRVVSIPPVMVTLLFVVLFAYKGEIFNNAAEAIVPIVLLGIVPVLAYPCQRFFPRFMDEGRDGQRKLAFIFSLVGYSAALVWALLARVGATLKLICLSYYFSAVILTILNKFMHIKASAHACSLTGPLVLLMLLVDWKICIPALAFAGLVAWSSIYLKRHTGKQFVFGASVYLLAILLSWLLLHI